MKTLAVLAFVSLSASAFAQTKSAGAINFSNTPTLPVQVGTSAQLPGTCTQGQFYFKNDVGITSGQRLYLCDTASTWVLYGSSPSAITSLTGDATASGPGSAALTLATVNSGFGTCGDSTHSCQVTTDAKGRITVQMPIAIAGGGGGGSGTPPFNPVKSGTTLTLGTASMGTPAQYLAGSAVGQVTTAPTLGITGGSGAVYVYIDVASSTLIAGITAGGSPSLAPSGITVQPGISGFPTCGVIPLFEWNGTSGAWDSVPLFNNLQTSLSGAPVLVAGTNVTQTCSGNSITTASSGGGGGGTTTIANGTAALGTSAVASGACATVVTSTATGVATTDDIQADFNADPTAVTGYAPSANGMLTIIKYPTSNNVNFKVCNNTAASVTPGAITLNWRVVR